MQAATDISATHLLPARLPRGYEVGGYVIEGWVRDGGMAAIYRATRADGERVALKLQLPSTVHLREICTRFDREAEAMRRTSGGANVVELFDAGVLDDGRRYFVMEWVEGEDLEELLDFRRNQDQRLSISQACSIGRDIALGLVTVHEQQLVHRDLKPANVMVREDQGDRPEIKLVDFGIVADLRSATGAGHADEQVMGTSAYMAPEQAVGQPPTPAMDLFALGVVLYEMLTGSCVPPHGWTPESLPPVESHRRGIPRELAALVRSCMSRDPAKRPPSAARVAQQLAEISRQLVPGNTAWGSPEPSPIRTGATEVLSPQEIEALEQAAVRTGETEVSLTHQQVLSMSGASHQRTLGLVPTPSTTPEPRVVPKSKTLKVPTVRPSIVAMPTQAPPADREARLDAARTPNARPSQAPDVALPHEPVPDANELMHPANGPAHPASGPSPAASEALHPASGPVHAASEPVHPASGPVHAASELSPATSEPVHPASKPVHAASGLSPATSVTRHPVSGPASAASETRRPASGLSPAASETRRPASGPSPAASETRYPASGLSTAASRPVRAASEPLPATTERPSASGPRSSTAVPSTLDLILPETHEEDERPRRRWLALVLLVPLLGVAAVLLLRGGGEDDEPSAIVMTKAPADPYVVSPGSTLERIPSEPAIENPVQAAEPEEEPEEGAQPKDELKEATEPKDEPGEATRSSASRIAPASHHPKARGSNNKDCEPRRSKAQDMKNSRDWRGVLDATSRRACWPGPLKRERRRLRVEAHAELGNFARCVKEGGRSSDGEIIDRVTLCKKMLER